MTRIPLNMGDYVDIKPVYDILNNCAECFKKYCILQTAVEISIFDRLVTPQTANDISHELGMDLNLVRNVFEALKMMGLVIEKSGLYENTEISNLFLRTDAPLVQHNVFKNLQFGLKQWENLPKALKNGPITVSEENGEFITLTLPDGVDLINGEDYADAYEYDVNDAWVKNDDLVSVTKINAQTLDVRLNTNDSVREKVIIKFPVKLDGAEDGDVTVVMSTSDSDDEYIVACLVDGDCTVTVNDTETIAEETAELGTIKISENSVLGMGNNNEKVGIRVTLPKDIDWSKYTDGKLRNMKEGDLNSDDCPYNFTGGLQDSKLLSAVIDNQDLLLAVELAGDRTQRGTFEIKTYVTVNKNADMGDIEVTVEGYKNVGVDVDIEANIDATDIVIGQYADWGVNCYADDELKTIMAGQLEQDLTTLKIDEGVAGSLLEGRKLNIEFPDYIRITKYNTNSDAKTALDVDYDNDYCELTCNLKKASSSSGYELEIDFQVSVAANAKPGDLVAKISGPAGAEGEVVLANIIKPVTISTTAKDIILGSSSQETGDIVINEVQIKAIMEGEIRIQLLDGVKWTSTPKVELTEGNLDIDENDISLEDVAVDDDTLSIKVEGESSRTSTITISDINLTVDQTIPHGPIKAEFVGTAFRENCVKELNDANMKAGMFDAEGMGQYVVANLITPATQDDGSFFIGSTTYSNNGVMKVMDAAPYIKNNRTYVPIRYLAYMLGVTDENITWDETTQTAILKKGEKIVQLVIGSTTILVNGEAQTMDVAPEITCNRTMLPARFVAEGLGYAVGWNASTQAVVISK